MVKLKLLPIHKKLLQNFYNQYLVKVLNSSYGNIELLAVKKNYFQKILGIAIQFH